MVHADCPRLRFAVLSVARVLVAVIAAVMLLARHRRKRGGSSKQNPAMDAYGGNAVCPLPLLLLAQNGGARGARCMHERRTLAADLTASAQLQY